MSEALTTVTAIRAEIETMIDAAGDVAVDAKLSKNDRRVGIIVLRLLGELLGKIPPPAIGGVS